MDRSSDDRPDRHGRTWPPRAGGRIAAAVVVALGVLAAVMGAGGCGNGAADGGGSADVPGTAEPSATVSALPVEFPDRYVNEEFGFAIKYDADVFDLEEEPGDDGAVAVVMDGAESRVGPPAGILVAVGPLVSGAPGVAGAPETILSLKGNLPRLARRFGVTLEGGVEDATVGGIPGVAAEISGPVPVPLDDDGLYGRMSMTAWEGTAMVVLEGAPAEQWAQARETTLTAALLEIDATAE